uniref:Uncharacterized protein n=1 Tax=Anopheles atroparvus TaxID=41427 RepID=A0A182JA06_ANOAO
MPRAFDHVHRDTTLHHVPGVHGVRHDLSGSHRNSYKLPPPPSSSSYWLSRLNSDWRTRRILTMIPFFFGEAPFPPPDFDDRRWLLLGVVEMEVLLSAAVLALSTIEEEECNVAVFLQDTDVVVVVAIVAIAVEDDEDDVIRAVSPPPSADCSITLYSRGDFTGGLVVGLGARHRIPRTLMSSSAAAEVRPFRVLPEAQADAFRIFRIQSVALEQMVLLGSGGNRLGMARFRTDHRWAAPRTILLSVVQKMMMMVMMVEVVTLGLHVHRQRVVLDPADLAITAIFRGRWRCFLRQLFPALAHHFLALATARCCRCGRVGEQLPGHAIADVTFDGGGGGGGGASLCRRLTTTVTISTWVDVGRLLVHVRKRSLLGGEVFVGGQQNGPALELLIDRPKVGRSGPTLDLYEMAPQMVHVLMRVVMVVMVMASMTPMLLLLQPSGTTTVP